MKNIIITISREEWEHMLEFKKTPIKKRYLEYQILFLDEEAELKNQSL